MAWKNDNWHRIVMVDSDWRREQVGEGPGQWVGYFFFLVKEQVARQM